MKWQDIIATPLFWIVSTTGTVVLSIIANLLTPWVSAFVTRNLHARKSGLRKKQIQRRDKVLTLQANLSRRTGAKLDAIFKLLLGAVLLLLGFSMFQLSSGGFHITAANKLSPLIQLLSLLSLLLVLLAMLGALVVFKLGLDDMALALTADRRERAGDDFRKQHGPASAQELKQVEDDWDLREFGVNSEHADLPAIIEHS